METVNVTIQPRTETGKKANHQIRKAGKIPAVLYGKDSNHIFTTTHREVKPLVYTPDFKLASIEIDGATHRAIVKDIQFHPVTEAIMHIDFVKLIDDQPIKVEVPIHFKGASPGVKEGGTLIQSMRKVKIKATPENLVHELIADISEVNLGEAIRVKELEIGEGIEVLSPPNTPVASVAVPRALKTEEEEAEEAAAEAAAEGEGTEGGEGEAAADGAAPAE